MWHTNIRIVGYYIFFIVLMPVVSSYISTKENKSNSGDTTHFYIVGHRGARGLMPENTIPAMRKAIRVGANTIEVDLQVTKDKKVVLNHDNTMNPYYVLNPDRTEIPKLPEGKRANNSFISLDSQDKYEIYKMNYANIRKFIVGEKFYPSFPEQQRINTFIPLFTELIDSTEAFIKKNNSAPVYYMPELKSDPDFYNTLQPQPEDFVKIVMQALKPFMNEIGDRLIVQCADLEPLRILHRNFPKVKLALLPKKKNIPIEDRVKELGFKPDFFLPRYSSVTPDLLKKCHSIKIKVIPWTLDNSAEMSRLITMGVDGIITNYPDRLTRVLQSMGKLNN